MAERRSRERLREGPPGLWDRPALLGAISDVLLVLGSAGLVYAVALIALRLPLFPLRELVVVTPLQQVTSAQLAYAARSSLAGNFFTVDLDRVRATFEKLPWVRNAEVRRRWPGILELEVEERRAAAYWRIADAGETRLVDEYGAVFVAASDAKLPVFSGPDGSAPLVLERYREFNQAVATLGRSLDGLALSPRLAWQMKLDNGMVIELGHDEPKAPVVDRLARFIAVYDQAAERFGRRVAVADLRYPNGFTLRPASGS